MTGQLIGIARRAERKAPMETVSEILITQTHGLDGDHKGLRFPKRQVTILACEDWQDALSELEGQSGKPVSLPWTARRANLLVEGLRLPRSAGSRLAVGEIDLEITGQTVPCKRMDEQMPGLRKALGPEWRGGVTCRVIAGGLVKLDAPVAILHAEPERTRFLP